MLDFHGNLICHFNKTKNHPPEILNNILRLIYPNVQEVTLNYSSVRYLIL